MFIRFRVCSVPEILRVVGVVRFSVFQCLRFIGFQFQGAYQLPQFNKHVFANHSNPVAHVRRETLVAGFQQNLRCNVPRRSMPFSS